MFSIAGRTLSWTLEKGPLVRNLRPTNSSPSTIMDALDLASNFRGHGWEWSHYQSYIPRETRSVNRIAFVFYAFVSAAAHALISGAFHRAVLTLDPSRKRRPFSMKPSLSYCATYERLSYQPCPLSCSMLSCRWFTTYVPYLASLSLDMTPLNGLLHSTLHGVLPH